MPLLVQVGKPPFDAGVSQSFPRPIVYIDHSVVLFDRQAVRVSDNLGRFAGAAKWAGIEPAELDVAEVFCKGISFLPPPVVQRNVFSSAENLLLIPICLAMPDKIYRG